MTLNCPLCGRTPSDVIHSFSSDDVAEFFTSPVLGQDKYDRMKEILNRMWRGDSVSVLRCNACDFGYADPFVAGTPEFYALEAPDTPYPRDKWEYERTLQCLADLSTDSTSLLDIGAGKGHFLSQLIDRGWNANKLMATEFSAAGRDAIGLLGVNCHPVDVRQLDVDDTRFDAVCMFQVLEHLDDYDGLFDAIARVTRPTADLFVAVPNGARIAFNEGSGLQYDSPPNHVSRWTAKSFEVLAEKYGWCLENCELEPRPTVMGEAVYGAVNRFVNRSHVPGTWARRVYAAASLPRLRGKANRLVKACGLLTSPDAWAVGGRVAFAARSGRGIPHALWAHLRRER